MTANEGEAVERRHTVGDADGWMPHRTVSIGVGQVVASAASVPAIHTVPGAFIAPLGPFMRAGVTFSQADAGRRTVERMMGVMMRE